MDIRFDESSMARKGLVLYFGKRPRSHLEIYYRYFNVRAKTVTLGVTLACFVIYWIADFRTINYDIYIHKYVKHMFVCF